MPKYKKQKVDYRVSQNFLTGGETIRRLLRLTDITRADTVVEIGAGRGHITRALARRSGRVLAYEIDPALSAYLAGRLPENVRLIRGDFLRAALPKGPYKVFANLPFCITTAALRRLTESGRPPEKAWLVLEKGAALRFCGEESRAGLGLRPLLAPKIV